MHTKTASTRKVVGKGIQQTGFPGAVAEPRTFLDHLLEGCQIIGRDWRYLYVNDAIVRQGRSTRKKLLGHTMMECYPGIEKTPFFSRLERCMRERVSDLMDNEFTFPDGSVGWFELRMEPVPEGVFILSIDITERRKVDQAKTEFVSIASHQLRTPLTSVNWYSEMLLSGVAGSDKKRLRTYVRKIHDGSRRMVSLVDSLLNVSRIELGTLAVERSRTDISSLLKEIVDEQRHEAQRAGVTVCLSIPKPMPVIDTDRNLLRMVFQNLLSNAVKYSRCGEGVSVTAAVEGKSGICIVFADTGYGIPKRQQDRVFEKMFRADNIRTKNISGTGLGLYIVKSVLAALGGTIRFESEENKGTTFFVTLPFGE